MSDAGVKEHHGRGALSNRSGRYQAHTREDLNDDRHDGWDDSDARSGNTGLPRIKTTVTVDASRSIITRNQSPDIPFDRSINPYRGCEHGCVYCFARPSHAYLGLSPGLDFETRLLAKPDAAALLLEELSRPNYRCAPIALGTNTDPYQPVEREWRITRAILEVMSSCSHPVTVVSKSALIERDLDILAPMARDKLVQVCISVTTLDRALARRLEPRAAAPQRRLEVLQALSEAGIPCGVLFAPVIPALNGAEMESVLATAREAGACFAGYVMLRLPLEVRDLFQEWLRVHAPLKAQHVMSLVRQMRGGKDYDPQWGTRMTGTGPYAQIIAKRFRLACQRLGLDKGQAELDCSRFQAPARQGEQLSLF